MPDEPSRDLGPHESAVRSLMAAADGDDPDHAILARAWEYEIIGINLQLVADPPFLDLTLRRAGEVRTLRFSRPSGVTFHQPFAGHIGLAIADLSGRGLEEISVRVYDREQDDALAFWAAGVTDVTGDGRGFPFSDI